MLLSLSLPLLMGIITRLALRPRGQGQNQPMTINAPWWALAGGWYVAFFIAIVAIPTINPELAIALIGGAAAVGLLLPEILRGLGAATTAALSRPRNWLIGGITGIVLYGLFFDSKTLEGIILLGMVAFFLAIILGWSPFKKKGGK